MRMRRGSRSLFGRDCLRAALLLIAGAALWGCGKDATYEADTSTPAPATACTITDDDIGKWIQNPSMPDAPAGTDPACFFNFAWQELFAVTHRGKDGVPTFATWPDDQKLFPASGDPEPWVTKHRRLRGRSLRKGLGMPGAGGFVADQITEAAALTPLVDQNGRFAHYSVLVNQREYDYVRCCELYRGDCFNQMGGVNVNPAAPSQIKLPDGSLELKLAWRALEKEDPSRYLTVQGEVQVFSPDDPSQPVKTRPALLGLVGMHIVHWTAQNPGGVWATFEHVDNAPDCPQPGSQPPSPPPGFTGWHFYNADCKAPSDNPDQCNANWYCLPCPITVPLEVAVAFNKSPAGKHWQIPEDTGVIRCTPWPSDFNKPVQLEGGRTYPIHLFDPKTCKKPPIPSQTCRKIPISSETDSKVKALNDQVRKVLAGPLGVNAAVLANYELAGVEWFGSAADDKQNKPPQGSPMIDPDDKTTVSLDNTTMETYLQALPAGCVLCHTGSTVNKVPSQAPMSFDSGLADRSMVFQQIRQFGAACTSQQAAKCSAWQQGCPAKM